MWLLFRYQPWKVIPGKSGVGGISVGRVLDVTSCLVYGWGGMLLTPPAKLKWIRPPPSQV